MQMMVFMGHLTGNSLARRWVLHHSLETVVFRGLLFVTAASLLLIAIVMLQLLHPWSATAAMMVFFVGVGVSFGSLQRLAVESLPAISTDLKMAMYSFGFSGAAVLGSFVLPDIAWQPLALCMLSCSLLAWGLWIKRYRQNCHAPKP
jgi:hypothetical protein